MPCESNMKLPCGANDRPSISKTIKVPCFLFKVFSLTSVTAYD